MIPWLFSFKDTRLTILILVILPLLCDPLSCCCCCCCFGCFWCCYCCCWWCYWSADSNTHHCHVCIREFCTTPSAMSRASPTSVLSVSCPSVHHLVLCGLAQRSMISVSCPSVHHVVLCGLAQCAMISVSVSCVSVHLNNGTCFDTCWGTYGIQTGTKVCAVVQDGWMFLML